VLPRALAHAKLAIQRELGVDLENRLRLEAERAFAVMAFVGKRKAVSKGR
jgi:hypothetical protein